MQDKTPRIMLGAVLAAAAALFAGAANAGFYGSHYDPNSFAGNAVFFVPDSPSPCLGLGPGFHFVNGETDDCTGVGLVSVSTDATDGVNTAHLSFSGFSTDISGMVLGFEEPLLQGINSGFIPLDCSGALCDGENWFIRFDSGLPLEAEISSFLLQDSNPLDGLNNQVFLYEVCSDCRPGPGNVFATANTDVTFVNIAEPGSLMLILGGLAAGWLARKRKIAA